MEIVVAFLIFLLSFILIYRNFYLSFYVLLVLSVLLHKELFSIYRWDLLPLRAFMLSLVCVAVVRFFSWLLGKNKKETFLKFAKNPFLVLLSLLWVIRGASIYFSQNLQSSLFLFSFFTTVVILAFFIFSYFSGDAQRILQNIRFYIYLVFGLTLFGYFQYFLYLKTGVIIGAFWNIPGNIARVGATFWDVNHYGALLAALIPVAAILTLFEKTLKRKIFFGTMLLSLLATLFLTNSRTAWMIDLFAGLFFLLAIVVKKIGTRGIAIVFLTLALLSVPFIIEYSNKASSFRAMIKQYFHYRMDSFDSHMLLLTGAIQVFEEYPILGGGYGGFFEHFSQTKIAPTYFGRDPAALNTRVPAHTIWGELLAETGVLGFSVFLLLISLIIGALVFSFNKSKDLKTPLISLAMASVVVGWMIAGIFYSYNSEFFWIILILYFVYGLSSLNGKFTFSDIVGFFIRSPLFCFVLIFILSYLMIFNGLGDNHLVPWDEAIYAKISKNMVVTNEYLVQVWKSLFPWYEKPPFYMWSMAFFMNLLGFNSWAAKLPSAIFGFSTVLLVFFLGKSLFNKTAGFLSAFVLLTTVHFLYYSRLSMTDVTATFFISLALFFYWSAKEKQKGLFWILMGISTGFAVMTKGIVGFLVFPVAGIYDLYLLLSHQQFLSWKLVKNYLMMMLFSALIFMPWHLEMYRRFGLEFINQYLGYHVLTRATEAVEDKGQPIWWYFIVMRVSMRLWFVALLALLPFLSFKLFKKDNRLVFLTIWMSFIFIFFSIAKSKLVWYILPLYPAAAILVGFYIESFLGFVMQKIKVLDTVLFKAFSIFLILVVGLMYLFYNKNMVYPSDLTGSQARLLVLKDEKLGTADKIYVDRVEYPLISFYSDSPFEVIDYAPDKGRIPYVMYQQPMIVLSKKGRFPQKIPDIQSEAFTIGEDGDYILFSYLSGYEVDKNKTITLAKQISSLSSQLSLDPENKEITAKIKSLQQEKAALEFGMTQKIGSPMLYGVPKPSL